MMIRMTLIAIAAAALLSLTGCNTIKGVGKDIHDATDNVQSWLEGRPYSNDIMASRK